MRILNCYCGIGGNRKLWSDEHEITAVEPKTGLHIFNCAFKTKQTLLSVSNETQTRGI